MDYIAASMIHADLLGLYKSGRLSDLTVSCGGRKYRVHKAIVCAQSPFFDRACAGSFKVGMGISANWTKEHEEHILTTGTGGARKFC